jgi:hypothetical protein
MQLSERAQPHREAVRLGGIARELVERVQQTEALEHRHDTERGRVRDQDPSGAARHALEEGMHAVRHLELTRVGEHECAGARKGVAERARSTSTAARQHHRRLPAVGRVDSALPREVSLDRLEICRATPRLERVGDPARVVQACCDSAVERPVEVPHEDGRRARPATHPLVAPVVALAPSTSRRCAIMKITITGKVVNTTAAESPVQSVPFVP